MWSTWTNLIHSLKIHCFDCVKQSYRLWVIFYLREFCSLDTSNIESLMSWFNWCHKSVWIYYYYLKITFLSCLFIAQQKTLSCVAKIFLSIQVLSMLSCVFVNTAVTCKRNVVLTMNSIIASSVCILIANAILLFWWWSEKE